AVAGCRGYPARPDARQGLRPWHRDRRRRAHAERAARPHAPVAAPRPGGMSAAGGQPIARRGRRAAGALLAAFALAVLGGGIALAQDPPPLPSVSLPVQPPSLPLPTVPLPTPKPPLPTPLPT